MNLKAFLTGALEATDHFGRNTAAPAVGGSLKAVADFGKNTLAPAAGEIANKANEFRQSHINPALCEGVKAAGEFKQNILAPAIDKGGKAIENLGQQVLGPPDEEAIDKSTVARILDKAKKLPKEAPKWVKEHPGQTAMYAASGVTLVAPGILAGPVLWAFGWGAGGMRAGTAAAAMQSAGGNVVARSAFAYLQSSAMGGYGVGVVHGVVRAGAAVAGAVGILSGTEKVEETTEQARSEAVEKDQEEQLD